jgi:hypothetical protein
MKTLDLKLLPELYEDSDESFALYLNNLIGRYKDDFLAFAAKNNVKLVRAYEDEKGQNLCVEAWDINEFLNKVSETDHSHLVVKSLVSKLTWQGAECIVLVIDMHHNCNAVYVRRVTEVER